MLLSVLIRSSLDRVDIVEGPHCAPDTVGYVVDTLDGDTVDVVTFASLDLGQADLAVNDTGGDTGSTGGETQDVRVVRVRMLGVDAPEIAHDSTEVADCYGDEAAEWARMSLLGRQVLLSFDATCEDTYGRALAYVFLTDDGDTYDLGDCVAGTCTVPDDTSASGVVLMNDIVIREGYARVYKDFDDIRLADLLYGAESAAKEDNRGLWSVCE